MSLDATNELAYKLLGCSLLQLDRSWWAVRLGGDTWVSEKQLVTDTLRGTRYLDWSLDLVTSGDVGKITELWLFCPPSHTSPMGNTAPLLITEPYSSFQFKLAYADSSGGRSNVAHIIGRVDDKSTGECTCYIWDPVQDGLCTPETHIIDPMTYQPMRDRDGKPLYAGKTNVHFFHTWRPGVLPPLGALALDVLGVRL